MTILRPFFDANIFLFDVYIGLFHICFFSSNFSTLLIFHNKCLGSGQTRGRVGKPETNTQIVFVSMFSDMRYFMFIVILI